MTEHSPSGTQAELDALRKRVDALESSCRVCRGGFSKGLALGLAPFVALLLTGGMLYANGDALFIDPQGRVGIGTIKPDKTLDVNGTLNVAKDTSLSTTGIKGTLTVTDGNVAIGGKANTDKQVSLQLRSGNMAANYESSQITFGYNNTDSYRHTIKSRHHSGQQMGNALDFYVWKHATDGAAPAGVHTMSLNGGNVGIGITEPNTKLDVDGVVRAKVFAATSPMRHWMYPADAKVYQDVFDARAAGVIAKLGNPKVYDDTSHNTNQKLWADRRMIKFGGGNETHGNGLKVTIPEGYNTVWIRVLGDRWNVVHAYFLDGAGENLGLWTGGRRGSNSYAPDGTLTDGLKYHQQWVPIPAGRSGDLALVSKPNTNADFWISGVAFSKNPWAHAVQSGISYHWKVNGGDATEWGHDDWNGDLISRIKRMTNWELKVPVVYSGRDKLLYLVEHNSNWNGTMHTGITVNGTAIQRFRATYDNPFARHWNSKQYERYVAAYIPASVIRANERFLSVKIDMGKQDEDINFREIGTHDVETPWAD